MVVFIILAEDIFRHLLEIELIFSLIARHC